MPKLLNYDKTKKYIYLSFFKGNKPNAFTKKHLNNFINFFHKINSNNHKNLPSAAESFSSSNGLKKLIINRINQVDLEGKHHPKKLYKISKKVLVDLKTNFDVGPSILNPSDFGLHNYLQNKNQFVFFDFEYSGNDCLLKCVMDFILHPANKFNLKNIKKISTLFSDVNDFSNMQINSKIIRIFVFWWILRLLNNLNDNNLSLKIKNGLLKDNELNIFIKKRIHYINKFYNYISND